MLVYIGFFIAFVVMGCLMGLTCSYVSGWHELAKQFKATQKPYGKAFFHQLVAIGPYADGNNIIIRTNREGLFVTMSLYFRCGNPDLFIPWNEMHELRRENRFLWGITFAIGDPQIGRITLPIEVVVERQNAA